MRVVEIEPFKGVVSFLVGGLIGGVGLGGGCLSSSVGSVNF